MTIFLIFFMIFAMTFMIYHFINYLITSSNEDLKFQIKNLIETFIKDEQKRIYFLFKLNSIILEEYNAKKDILELKKEIDEYLINKLK